MATEPRHVPVPKRVGTSSSTALNSVVTKPTTVCLEYPASALRELLEQAAREDARSLAFVNLLLTRQCERKDERHIMTILQLSSSPPG